MRSVCRLFAFFLLISVCVESQTASLYGLNYNPEDFVVAQPTCVHRLPLTRVNRLWRGKGIRSFTVVNNTVLVHDLNNDPSSQGHLEAYGYWEDDSIADGTWRGGNVGDTRAAVTPFLAHRHFGETYKWMLYGDDDTLFYMTGVLKLLSQFDPEQPLAITDNIWFYAKHTNPGAPRCLPCGFNTSTIKTNHTFTPRPACPFCARALACGTYGPRYRCNASHLNTLEAEYGPTLLAANASTFPGGGAATAATNFRNAWHRSTGRYAAWMDHHVALKAKLPKEFKDKPTMDWEMRDRNDWHTTNSDFVVDRIEVDDTASGQQQRMLQRRRRRRRRRGILQVAENMGTELDDLKLGLDLDPSSSWGHEFGDGSSTEAGAAEEEHNCGEEADLDLDVDLQQRQARQQRSSYEARRRGRRRRLLGSGRKLPVAQNYVDGTSWLSAALGRPLGGPEDPERQALQLPYPFCARHDDRLHGEPTPSCLLSVAGHGGTGIIFSVGLMRMIEAEDALRFIMTQSGCGGGDCLVGRLLWYRMGIGFTDPGTALQYGAAKYEKYCRFVDSNEQLPQIAALSDPSAMLLGRWRAIPRSKPCDHSCVWLFENVVGLHVRAQNRQVNATALEMVKRIHSHKRAYEWILEARRDPEVQAGRTNVVRWIKARYSNITLPQIASSHIEEIVSSTATAGF